MFPHAVQCTHTYIYIFNSYFCLYCVRTNAAHKWVAIANCSDGDVAWLNFLNKYLDTNGSDIRVRVLIDSNKLAKKHLFFEWKCVLYIKADLSALWKLLRAKQLSNFWIVLVEPGKGDVQKNKYHSFEGDKLSFQGSIPDSTFFQCKFLTEVQLAERKENGKRLPQRLPTAFLSFYCELYTILLSVIRFFCHVIALCSQIVIMLCS